MTSHGETADRLYIDLLLEQLSIQSDKAVLRYRCADITGDALRSAIFRYARALGSLGIGKGSLVALLAPNCPDALAIRYAASVLGAATTFLPALRNVGDQGVLVARIRPTLLVVFAETAHLVRAGVPERVVFVGMGVESSRLDKLAQAHSREPLPIGAMPDDLAVIVSSGGTTDVPKFSRRSFAIYSAMAKAERAEDKRQLINGPLAYISQVLVDSTL
ncbi:AMP-binding protein, partial [Burkholderia sp. L27(2015)]|uniref:AMP-binding protein n=1 Tax=Burkholderia sp. L27(2015) TaxID=1641858 RepID=UPI00131AB6A7